MFPSTFRWTVEVYVPPIPHQGVPVVFGYTYVYRNDVLIIYIGGYTCKYIGHETENWLGGVQDVDRQNATVKNFIDWKESF